MYCIYTLHFRGNDLIRLDQQVIHRVSNCPYEGGRKAKCSQKTSVERNEYLNALVYIIVPERAGAQALKRSTITLVDITFGSSSLEEHFAVELPL